MDLLYVSHLFVGLGQKDKKRQEKKRKEKKKKGARVIHIVYRGSSFFFTKGGRGGTILLLKIADIPGHAYDRIFLLIGDVALVKRRALCEIQVALGHK